MTDSVLILRLQNDDRQAFKHLFVRYHKIVYRFLYYFLGASPRETNEIAEDLMQDVFLKVWQHRHDLDPDQPIQPYLLKTARNLAITHLRHQQVVNRWTDKQRTIPPSTPLSPDAIVEGSELESAIRKAIQELPERCALIFILSRYEGYSYQEIADSLALSLQTVKNQMSKALAVLKAKLNDYKDYR